MPKRVLLIACALMTVVLPGRTELLQVDLSIFGMD
jgi:hypothetical protein